MNWVHQLAACNVWYWFLQPEMPNGWSAGVSDDSQCSAPVQPTRYHAFASAKMQYVSAGYYNTLEEAKREAVLLALAQPQAATTNEELIAMVKS